VVLGSLNMDLALACERLPQEGETLLAGGGLPQAGGKGGNQAVQVARLGARVEMIGRVGADLFGRRLVDELVAEGVGTAHVRGIDGMPTGLAAVLRLPGGGNAIVVAGGANQAWKAGEIDAVRDVITGAAMLLLQLETPLDVVARAAQIARAAGVPVLLNPAPAAQLPDHLVAACDFLVPNQHEAATLTGLAVDGAGSAVAAALVLQRRGAANVVITAGAAGAIVLAAGTAAVTVAAPAVDAVDTTAAGDSFCGALAVALCDGRRLVDAARFACQVAATSVTDAGSQSSLPRRAELAAADLPG
jgi:ribokinase